MNELAKDLFSSEELEGLILNESQDLIENIDNKDKYISSFIEYFTKEYGNADSDFIEYFDVDPPDYEDMEIKNNRVEIIVSLPVGISVWRENKQLGKVSATLKGVYSFILNQNADGFDIEDFKVERLINVEQYFEDYSFLE